MAGMKERLESLVGCKIIEPIFGGGHDSVWLGASILGEMVNFANEQ